MTLKIHFVFGNCRCFCPVDKYKCEELEQNSIFLAEYWAENNLDVCIYADKTSMSVEQNVNGVFYKFTEKLFCQTELDVLILNNYAGINTYMNLTSLNISRKLLFTFVWGDLSYFDEVYPEKFLKLENDSSIYCFPSENFLEKKFVKKLNIENVNVCNFYISSWTTWKDDKFNNILLSCLHNESSFCKVVCIKETDDALYSFLTNDKITTIDCSSSVLSNTILRNFHKKTETISLNCLRIVLTHIAIMNRVLHDNEIQNNIKVKISALGKTYKINKFFIQKAIELFNTNVMTLEDILYHISS
jgi:hypothetical protein